MTDGYDCYQNALAERVNGILKNEFLLSRPADLAQVREMVKQSVSIYNYERPHLALKYKTLDEVHQAFTDEKLSTYIRTSHVPTSRLRGMHGVV
ncbi:integrase core domain-containing protein [Klebsiella aerogenes]|nr:integrase core domain-containing protein [Klebsiella aerogenes]WPS05103.1 integrase core domain-containing protein [Klebsiella aerogenes]